MAAVRLCELCSILLRTVFVGSDAVSKVGKITRRCNASSNRCFWKYSRKALESKIAIRMLNQQPRNVTVLSRFRPAARCDYFLELFQIFTIDRAPALL